MQKLIQGFHKIYSFLMGKEFLSIQSFEKALKYFCNMLRGIPKLIKLLNFLIKTILLLNRLKNLIWNHPILLVI